MKLLEYYQNQAPNSENFVPRKCQLNLTRNINLYGVRGAGKTSLVLDYLQEQENKYLYIDCDNPNLILNNIEVLELKNYLKNNQIKILILDHYQEELHFDMPTLEIKYIIITRKAIFLENQHHIELFPLDYEEFLAFEQTSMHNKSFNNFLRSGTLPLLARNPKNHSHAMKLFFQSAFDNQEQKLLLILAKHHTKHLTTHQIYTFAKEQFKISKDWLYKTIKTYKEEKLLIFIDDHYQKSGKKMLLFDFAFAKYLTLGQPFILQFDTMIALALMKHHIKVETLGIHGYLTKNQEIIIPAPFESEESLWVKSQQKFSLYKKYNIKKVTIITMSNHYEYSIEKLVFEALPFDEWSVISEEESILI
jgi:predicted AAA+ superfamily ATPase